MAGILLIAAACTGGPADVTTTTEPADVTTSQPGLIEITGIAFGYLGIPSTVPLGTRLEFVNGSEEEFHELVVFRLSGDDTRAVEDIMLLPADELINQAGALVGVAFALPGESAYEYQPALLVLDQPGRYIFFCTVPEGADPEEVRRQVETGRPSQIDLTPAHYQLGMFAEIVVEDR